MICFLRFLVVIRTKFYTTCLSKELLAMKTGSIRNFLGRLTRAIPMKNTNLGSQRKMSN